MDNYKNKTNVFDIKIICTDGELYFSKYLLAKNSEYFKTYFEEKYKEKNITEINMVYSTNIIGKYLCVIDNENTSNITFEDLIDLKEIFDFTLYKVKYIINDSIYNYIKQNYKTLIESECEILVLEIINTCLKENYSKYEFHNILTIYSKHYETLDKKTINKKLQTIKNPELISILSRGLKLKTLNYYFKWLEYNINEENINDMINEKYVNIKSADGEYYQKTIVMYVKRICVISTLITEVNIKLKILDKITFLMSKIKAKSL